MVPAVCKDCGLTPESTKFHRKHDTRTGFMSVCVNCHNARLRKKAEVNKNVVARKVCNVCKVEKSTEEFPKRSSGKFGVMAQCRDCFNDIRRSSETIREGKRRWDRLPETKAKRKAYAALPEVRERTNAANRARLSDPEKRPQILEYHKQYYRDNTEKWQTPEYKESRKEYNKKYYARPEIKERQREWHREYYWTPQYQAYNQRPDVVEGRRAREKVRGVKKYKEPKYLNQHGVCPDCGEWKPFDTQEWHIDHIFPLSVGLKMGLSKEKLNQPENLQALCLSCNVRKKDKVTLVPVGWMLKDSAFWSKAATA